MAFGYVKKRILLPIGWWLDFTDIRNLQSLRMLLRKHGQLLLGIPTDQSFSMHFLVLNCAKLSIFERWYEARLRRQHGHRHLDLLITRGLECARSKRATMCKRRRIPFDRLLFLARHFWHHTVRMLWWSQNILREEGALLVNLQRWCASFDQTCLLWRQLTLQRRLERRRRRLKVRLHFVAHLRNKRWFCRKSILDPRLLRRSLQLLGNRFPRINTLYLMAHKWVVALPLIRTVLRKLPFERVHEFEPLIWQVGGLLTQ